MVLPLRESLDFIGPIDKHTTNGSDSLQNACFRLLNLYFESVFDVFEFLDVLDVLAMRLNKAYDPLEILENGICGWRAS